MTGGIGVRNYGAYCTRATCTPRPYTQLIANTNGQQNFCRNNAACGANIPGVVDVFCDADCNPLQPDPLGDDPVPIDSIELVGWCWLHYVTPGITALHACFRLMKLRCFQSLLWFTKLDAHLHPGRGRRRILQPGRPRPPVRAVRRTAATPAWRGGAQLNTHLHS